MPTDPHLLLFVGCILHVLPWVAGLIFSTVGGGWLLFITTELLRRPTGKRRKAVAPVVDGDHDDVPTAALQKLTRGLTAAGHLPRRKQVQR